MVNNVNAQEWLESQEEYNTKEKREEITDLDISNKELEGELDLSDFADLKRLNIGFNKITNLKLAKRNKLKILDARCNNLTNLSDLTNSLNKKSLKKLKLSDNNFRGKSTDDFINLSDFADFTNLELLWVGNYGRKTDEKIYNRFSGSLELLRTLTRLEDLEVGLTDIDLKLKEIPKSVKTFWYWNGDEYKGIGTPNSNDKAQGLVKKLGLGENHEVEKGKKYNPWKKITKIEVWLEGIREERRKSTFFTELFHKSEQEKILFVRSSYELGGELVINGKEEEFSSLEKLYCYNNQLTSLKLKNLSKLTEVQAWDNQLVNLEIANCPSIETLNVSGNYLTDLNFLDKEKIKGDRLKVLDIANNNIGKKDKEEDLEIFKNFTSLEKLYIGSWDSEANKGSYNEFAGSLEPLKELNELKFLNIDNTNINEGLKYLPKTLKEIQCDNRVRKNAKCREIQEKLEEYSIPGKIHNYDYRTWKKEDENREINEDWIAKFCQEQWSLIKSIKEIIKNEEDIEKNENYKKLGKDVSYGGDVLTLAGASVNGIVSSVGFPHIGSIVSLASASLGSSSSVLGKRISSHYEKNLKELNGKEINAIEVWNNFLRNLEELEKVKEKVSKYIIENRERGDENNKIERDEVQKKLAKTSEVVSELESRAELRIEEAVRNLRKETERLPKSISSGEMQRMDNNSKDKFIKDLGNIWKTSDIEKKLRKFLYLAERDPQKNIQNKLDNLLEELRGIEEEYSSDDKKKNIWEAHEKELKKFIRNTEEVSKKIGKKISSSVKERKEHLDSPFTVCSLCFRLVGWWEKFGQEHPTVKDFFKESWKFVLSESWASKQQKETSDSQPENDLGNNQEQKSDEQGEGSKSKPEDETQQQVNEQDEYEEQQQSQIQVEPNN